jgi:MFS family permease
MTLPARSSLYSKFPALQHRNYRLYFYGQLISFTGSWLQGVAQGWLTYQLTHSAFWLGIVTAVSTLPVLFLSLFGGFLVDKYDRRKILLLTQSASLILAFLLGVSTLTHHINLPVLIIITLLSGVANAVDNPASNAFVVDIVPKEDLPSAIGLNATMFNTGRVLGPAVAGFLIAIVGLGNIFLINAGSFLAILVSLFIIKVNSQNAAPKQHPILAIKQGMRYSIRHPQINKLLLTAGIGSIFCFSQATIMPVFVKQIFATDTQTLGFLLSATGLGALSASLIISSQYKKIKPLYFIMFGSSAFVFSSFAFSFTTNIPFAAVLLCISGFGLTLQFSTVYATIQKLVHEEFRGRVSSIYVLLFVGLSPIGNIAIGALSTVLGPQMAIRLFCMVIFLYSASMAIYLHKLPVGFQLFRRNIKPVFVYAFNRIR